MISISKSTVKASACELYFDKYVIKRIAQFPIELTIAGSEFHEYRSKYVDHLVETGARSDPEWALSWLEAAGVSQEGRDLIERDIPWFEIDPEAVFATELFLVVNDKFEPIRGVPFPGFGKPPDHPEAYVHGTIDIMMLPTAEQADIDDYKSGWAEPEDEYEAEHYVALVFAHFPSVQVVTFGWRYPRRGRASERKRYTRFEHFEWLKSKITTNASRIENMRSELEAGRKPTANPFSDMCPYCTLECPVRRMAVDREFPVAALQNDEDARNAARYMAATRSQLGRVEKMLRTYCDARGPVPVSKEKVAGIVVRDTKKLPLRPVLAKLGVDVPEVADFDMPLDKLYISSEKFDGYTKAKKREGVQDAIREVLEMKPRKELKIYLASEDGVSGVEHADEPF